jgi:predicted DNA-binding protein (MmcQ/YjbR family)
MTDYADVPPEVVDRLRAVCLALPDAYEEQAWAGTRWRIRKRTFAHVLAIDSQWPAAYAAAMEATGPVTVLTFRSEGPELDSLTNSGHPFYRPGWAPNIVGMILDEDADWDEIGELLTESYRIMAPKKLAERVHQPPAP